MEFKVSKLLDCWFHTFDEDGLVKLQGKVIEQIGHNHFVCVYFSSMTGEPTHKKIHPMQSMLGWDFFDDIEDKHKQFNEHMEQRKNKQEKV